jgi:SWI/SNF-related matrix-associated actin-dependent regulator of chromatin subfamily A-like protein 1
MPYWVEELRKQQPQVLVLDEIHYIKSNSAQRTKATKKLAKGIPYIIGLGGTFIVNRPIEGYNALKLISPSLFPDYWAYAREYCNATYNGFGWNFNGASNVEELHRILTSTVMIRRLKKDVLQDLPDKIYSFVPMELDNEKEYEDAERDFIAFVRAEKGKAAAERASNAIAFAKTEGLRQLAVKGKLKHAIAWIRDFLEEDNKLVVFASHKFVIEALMTEFADIAVKIDGTTSMTGRQMAVEDFQHKKHVRLFIGNIKAAGVGITLTAASNVAFLELPWTPGDLVQAQDRCHRIGQKECVNIHYLLARDTIEEKIARVIDRKQVVLDAILDGKETSVDSLLQELMNQYDEE